MSLESRQRVLARGIPQGDGRPLEVAFICMPFQWSPIPSLSMSLLKSILTKAGICAQVLYLNISFLGHLPPKLAEKIARSRIAGQLVFTPSVMPLPKEDAVEWRRQAQMRAEESDGISSSEFDYLADVYVPRFLDACVERLMSNTSLRVIGFSLTFGQTPASLAMAARLAERAPHLKLIAGGMGANGECGVEIMRRYYNFHIMFDGEAEESIVGAVNYLMSGGERPNVVGQIHRDAPTGGGAAQPTDLAALPAPDYGDYFRTRAAYDLRGDVWLPFETSRGCWWGERSVCAFCGLNGDYLNYRIKPVQHVGRELRQLRDQYSIRRFQAADNIIADRKAERSLLLPQLTEFRQEAPDTQFFFQIKSNIDRPFARALRAAGIKIAQPGIEAFDDRLLKDMRKGASALTQVQCIKLLAEQRIEIVYGVLYGLVGETIEQHQAQCSVMAALTHLPPPQYCEHVTYDRYSPYITEPEQFAVLKKDLPRDLGLIYPFRDFDLSSLATEYSLVPSAEYDTPEYVDTIGRLKSTIETWRRSYAPDRLLYHRLNDGSVVVEDRRGISLETRRLSPRSSEILLASEEVTTISRVAGQLAIAPKDVLESAHELKADGLMMVEGQRALALPVRRMRKLAIALIGKSCVGKTTVANIFRRQEMKILDVGEILLAELGPDFWALSPQEKLARVGKDESIFHFISPWITRAFAETDIVIIDSFKARLDLHVAQALNPQAEFRSLLVDAPADVRGRRFIDRNRPGDEPTLAEKDAALEKIGIDELIERASHRIVNAGDSEQLCRAMGVVMEDFLVTLHSEVDWPGWSTEPDVAATPTAASPLIVVS